MRISLTPDTKPDDDSINHQSLTSSVQMVPSFRSLISWCLFLLLITNESSGSDARDIRLQDNTAKGVQLAPNVLPELRGEHLTYSLLQTRGSHYFSLNNRTGQLNSARLIDRDLLCSESGLCCTTGGPVSTDNGRLLGALHMAQVCQGRSVFGPSVVAQACLFNLSVSVVSAQGQQPDIHEITITICEENDHTPEFKIPGTKKQSGPIWTSQSQKDSFFLTEPTQYIVNVSEAVSVDQRIRLPLAEDIDAPPYNVQRYELERLDSMQVGSPYHSRSSQSPFRLEVIWDGDTPLTPPLTSYAAGVDTSNGRTGSSIVGLDLVVTDPLDRETVARYQYRVLAIDGGSPPLTGTLHLEVRVLDMNDHAPEFTQTLYETTVDEGVTGKEIIRLVARDADEGPNAVVRYDWPDSMAHSSASAMGVRSNTNGTEPSTRDELMAAPPSYWFHLNGETGAISIRRPLDYEIKAQHRFQIVAHNPVSRIAEPVDRRGVVTHRTMTATASVIVHVRNLDDEAPHIVIDYVSGPNQAYKEIKENAASSFFVAFVTASDPDVVSNELARVDSYRGPGDSSFPDSPPAYGPHGSIAALVGHATVTCQLDSHQDTYILVPQQPNKAEPGALEQRYSLLTRRSLDREQSAVDRIRIVCQDSGSPPKTATAIAEVRVLDENDCAPKLQVFSAPGSTHSNAPRIPLDPWSFSKLGQWIEQQREAAVPVHPSLMCAYLAQVPVVTVHVAENQPPGTVFARVRATDPDAGDNGRVTFDLPRQPPLINVSVPDSSSYAEFVTHPYAKIELTSSPEAAEYFSIDPTRGDLSTHKLIDREEGYAILEQVFVVVQATDHGSPNPRSAFLLLHVLIDDENDNSPVFVDPKMHFSIRENLPAPAVVGEIRVIDPDLRPVGTLDSYPIGYEPASYTGRSDYAILRPYPHVRRPSPLHVRIDPSHNRRDLPFILYPTAEGRFFLNTTRSLDRESEEAFQFVLVAVDGGAAGDMLQSNRLDHTGRIQPLTTHHTATASVLVTVLDANDNQPEIIFPNPSASNSTVHRVSYRELAGYEIVNINANDRDAGETNGKFYFELVPGSRAEDLFTIDRATGLLRTRRRLTKEDLGEHTLQVVVRDEGTPPLETQISLRLVVDQSEPHWPYAARTNADYLGSRSAMHSDRSTNDATGVGYLSKGAIDAGVFAEGADLSSPLELKRSIHADIVLFVIVALILALIVVMLGLCFYLRHKRNLFLFLPDLCAACICAGRNSEPPNRAVDQKTNYTKTYLDLEHRAAHNRKLSTHPDPGGLMTSLLSADPTGERKLLHPFSSTSPLQSPIPSARGHQLPSTAGAASGHFTQPHFHSSLNLNSPYGSYTTSRDQIGACPMIDGMPIRQGLAFSPTMIGSEGLFCPSTAAVYRPGTAMAVNIPDVANQAETMHKQYLGYCRTTHPGIDFGPPLPSAMDQLPDAQDFVPSRGNGPLNTYNVGHYGAGHRVVGQNYSSDNAVPHFGGPTASFDQFAGFGFRAIDDDPHQYQRIAPMDQYVGEQTITPQRNVMAMKSSQDHGTRGSKKNANRGPDHTVDEFTPTDSNWKSQLTPWRSDPSLNHFDVAPVEPYVLRSGHRSIYEFNNTIHVNATPRKRSLKRSNSNKHSAGPGHQSVATNGYYATLHESLKNSGSPKLMLVDFAGSKLVPEESAARPIGNYAVSFPKVQASFV